MRTVPFGGHHQMSVLIAGVGPQGNKFEQVSCDDQQMSVAGDGGGAGLRSKTSWIMVTWGLLIVDRQNDRNAWLKTFTFPPLHWRAVIYEGKKQLGI